MIIDIWPIKDFYATFNPNKIKLGKFIPLGIVTTMVSAAKAIFFNFCHFWLLEPLRNDFKEGYGSLIVPKITRIFVPAPSAPKKYPNILIFSLFIAVLRKMFQKIAKIF